MKLGREGEETVDGVDGHHPDLQLGAREVLQVHGHLIDGHGEGQKREKARHKPHLQVKGEVNSDIGCEEQVQDCNC